MAEDELTSINQGDPPGEAERSRTKIPEIPQWKEQDLLNTSAFLAMRRGRCQRARTAASL